MYYVFQVAFYMNVRLLTFCDIFIYFTHIYINGYVTVYISVIIHVLWTLMSIQ